MLYLHEDAMEISTVVASKKFDRILVDSGSSIDVLFKSTLDEIGITGLRLENISTSLKGFGGRRLTALRMVKLFVTIDSTPFEKIMMLDFMVVDKDNSYQIILGKLFFRISKVVVSNHYLAQNIE